MSSSDKHYNVNQPRGFCPVCRKVFDEKDIEHVRDLLGDNTSRLVCIRYDSCTIPAFTCIGNLVSIHLNIDHNIWGLNHHCPSCIVTIIYVTDTHSNSFCVCLFTFQASLTVDLGEDEKELLHSEAEQNRRKRIESLVNVQQELNGLIEPKKDLAIQPGMYVSVPPSTPDTAEEENADPSQGTATSTSETEQRGQASNASSNKPKNPGHRRRNRANASRRQPHGQGQPARQQWQRKEAGTSHQ